MINNRFSGTGKNLLESELNDVQKKFAFKFPNEVKEFYLEYNGGEPERYIFVDSDGDIFTVQKFLPIKYSNKKNNTIEGYLEDFREDGILPEWLIPFAYDPGGDIYGFSTRTEDNGAIYYWSHECDSDEDPEDYLIKLSDSMYSFINKLTND